MDWQFTLLLLAIAVTWFAWRRTRRANELARARAAMLEGARWNYRLESARDDGGRGYVVTAPDGTTFPPDALSWTIHGLEVVAIDETTADPSAMADESFDPGSGIRLTAAADGDGIEVWDDAGSLRLGVLTERIGERVGAQLESGELSDCVVLWESRRDGERTAVHLLLVHGETAVDA